MNTKIWLEELSFGSNFGNLRAIGSSRVWWYFLVHIFKIKKFESISSNSSRDIAKSLKIAFDSNFVSLCPFGSKFWQFRFPAFDYLYPLLSFSVHNFCAWTAERSDRYFRKFSFSSWSRIYICMYVHVYRLFLKFHPPVTNVGKRYNDWH